MARKPKKRHRGPRWSAARVYSAHRPAPILFLVLCALGGESGCCTPTREQLGELTGIKRLNTISKALSVLHSAGWIKRVNVPITVGGKQTASVLRIWIKFRMPHLVPLTEHTPVCNTTCGVAKQHVVLHDSLKREGEGALLNAAPSPKRQDAIARLFKHDQKTQGQ